MNALTLFITLHFVILAVMILVLKFAPKPEHR